MSLRPRAEAACGLVSNGSLSKALTSGVRVGKLIGESGYEDYWVEIQLEIDAAFSFDLGASILKEFKKREPNDKKGQTEKAIAFYEQFRSKENRGKDLVEEILESFEYQPKTIQFLLTEMFRTYLSVDWKNVKVPKGDIKNALHLVKENIPQWTSSVDAVTSVLEQQEEETSYAVLALHQSFTADDDKILKYAILIIIQYAKTKPEEWLKLFPITYYPGETLV